MARQKASDKKVVITQGQLDMLNAKAQLLDELFNDDGMVSIEPAVFKKYPAIGKAAEKAGLDPLDEVLGDAYAEPAGEEE